MIVLSNEITHDTSFTIRGNIIYWSTLKCKRITRSVLASKIYAIAYNVFHYHVGQPITSDKMAWQHHLPYKRDMSQQQDAQLSN